MPKRLLAILLFVSAICVSETPIRLGFCSQITKNGLVVTGVGKASPAEKAGLKSGDLIIHVQGMTITGENLGADVAAYMDKISAAKGMGGPWIFTIKKNTSSSRIELKGEPYEDPLRTSPFKSSSAPEIPRSQRITLPWIQQLISSASVRMEASEFVYIGEADFDGEQLKGSSSYAATGVIRKKPTVSMFMASPKSMLKKELFNEPGLPPNLSTT